MHDLIVKLALIVAAGIGAQWLAWRLQLPAIVLLLAAGFIAGPATGFIDPLRDFGDIYRPVVSLSVAIILFEGGLTLNLKEIRETSRAVRRIIFVAGPLVWVSTALAARYFAGLSWPSASVLGAILVVTGPTVVMPLLRQAQLKPRVASLLRWEAIINDAVGALFAVLAFEGFLAYQGAHHFHHLGLQVLAAAVAAIGGGFLLASVMRSAFSSGNVPEFLKAPVVLATALGLYSAVNLLLEEAGLLAVTVMGAVMANSRLASLAEMRRFKETVTLLLVSSLFIILTAALDIDTLKALDWRAAAFVGIVLFCIRPLAILVATIGTGITWRETILTGWIAPRGVVAVAVSGLFATALAERGVDDAGEILTLTFAIVVSTIVLHGFSLVPLARLLDLQSATKPGVLIVGGSRWATALAKQLKSMDIPVLIADQNWEHIRDARLLDVPVYFGEVLSEDAHHQLDLKAYANLIAATDNDAYNTLVCTDFGPELGRNSVYQIGTTHEQPERKTVHFTLGGRPLTSPGETFQDLRLKVAYGWDFQATRLSAEFGFDEYMRSRAPGTQLLFWRKPSGALVFFATRGNAVPGEGDSVVCFGPPSAESAAS